MDQLSLYRVFVRVVETRSFTRAANTLQMPRSSVSTAIAELESRLGTRLLNRTTRVVAPTDEGDELYERAILYLAEGEAIQSMFRSADRTVEGRIRVNLPGRIGRLIVAPALPEFLSQWPGMRVELGVTDREVDLLEEQVDLALRIGTLPDSSLKARSIGTISQINVASPSYLSEHGTPVRPSDLTDHWQVAYASPSTGRIADWEWLESGKIRSCPVPWRVSVNNAESYIACAVAGMGLIQIPAYDVARDILKGDLIEVMPAFRPAPMPMHLLFPGPARALPRLTSFADWIGRVLRQHVKD